MIHRYSLFHFAIYCLWPAALLPAQKIAVNYDEAKVPSYDLPDPLVMNDGTHVTDIDQWPARRAEIMAICRAEMYGQQPPAPKALLTEIAEDGDFLNGKAIRRQIIMYIGNADQSGGQSAHHKINVVLYLPKSKSKHPVPAFVGVNFKGNHAISDDPNIIISPHFIAERPAGQRDEASLASTRGVAAARWPIETIIDRGYAIATFYCGDVDPDRHDEFKNGIHSQFPKLQESDDNFATIGAWAWGLSRVLDYFEKDPQIDAERVAVFGHSRMGKTSLWAGATDPRFAMVISNDSGSGGAALSRRQFGERVEHLNTRFPHWFCKNFSKYNGKEGKLPLDQHFVFSLIAPRPAYVASAAGDRWADPKGEFLAIKAAEPVYALFGKDGTPADRWPAINAPSHGTLGYHVRNGKHNINDYDWAQYLEFADKHLGDHSSNGNAARKWGSLLTENLLDHWTILPAGEWKMTDGILRGTSTAAEKRHGMLLSKERYGDFKVTAIYRSNKGNSGLYFRSDVVKSGTRVNGFQAEIDPKNDVGGLYETGGRAWVVKPTAEQVATYFKPSDWNEMTVVAKGRDITVHVNGTLTAELKNDRGRTEGHFGLQLHGGQDMDVEFKSVVVEAIE